MCPEGAQVELKRERCVLKVLKLSSDVSERKPLPHGNHHHDGDKRPREPSRTSEERDPNRREPSCKSAEWRRPLCGGGGLDSGACTRSPFSST
jgi:hypothetical protein